MADWLGRHQLNTNGGSREAQYPVAAPANELALYVEKKSLAFVNEGHFRAGSYQAGELLRIPVRQTHTAV